MVSVPFWQLCVSVHYRTNLYCGHSSRNKWMENTLGDYSATRKVGQVGMARILEAKSNWETRWGNIKSNKECMGGLLWNERNVLGQILQNMRGQVSEEKKCVSMQAVHQEASFMLLSCRMLPYQMTSHHELKSRLLPITLDSIFFIFIFSPSSHLTHDRY